MLDEPMNADAFLTYVTRVLLPELARGDVVIMDNLSNHKAAAICAAIESVGATLLFLPPYSPVFNPKSTLATICQNLLAGLASPAVRAMIKEREAEKLRLEASAVTSAKPMAQILPHPTLLELFARKVEALRATLDDAAVRTEAAQVLSTLIESVTIYPGGERGAEAEVVAKVSDLITWATNDNAALGGGASCSTLLVAGTGFEPVTFRL